MKLHEAITKVLNDAGQPLSARDIADVVNSKGLYQKGDGSPVLASQIIGRTKKYLSLFAISNGKIFIRQESSFTKPNLTHQLKILEDANRDLISSPKKLTLHEAIDQILRKHKKPMSASEIAFAINREQLYYRNDNLPLPASQVIARVNNYQHLFSKNKDGFISRKTDMVNDLINIATRMQNILDTNGNFFQISIKQIHLQVPAIFFFKRMIDNPEWNKQHLNLNTSHFSFDFISYKDFLEVLNSHSGSFKGKLDGLIKDAEVISMLGTEKALLQELKLISLATNEISVVEFGIFFNRLIHAIGKVSFKAGQFTSPDILVDLISGLCPQAINESTSIYNPATGFATIPTILSQNAESSFKFFGEELNPDIYLLATMNLIANDIQTTNFQNADTFIIEREQREFDLVLCVPPFVGQYVKQDIHHTFPVKTTDLNLLFIQKCMMSLKTNGKAFILIPEGVLQSKRNDFTEIRNYLFSKNLIEGIISLPIDLLFPYTSIKTSLLILSNSNNQDITFIDAEDIQLSPKQSKIQNKKIILDICEKYSNLYPSLFEDSILSDSSLSYGRIRRLNKSYKSMQGMEMILSSKLNLALEGQKKKDGKVPLSNMLSRYEAQRPELSGKLPYVNISALNQDAQLLYLNESSLTKTADMLKGIIVDKPALLISTIPPNPKPTFYLSQKSPVLVSRNILVFKVSEELIDLEYLISQISTNDFIEQFQGFAMGSTSLRRISVNDFLRLKIKLPSLQEQKKIVRIQKESIYSKKISEAREFALKSGITARSEKELLGFVKHEIGNLSSGIQSDIISLKTFLNKKDIDFSENLSNSPQSASLEKAFARMQSNMHDIENLMTRMEAIIDLANTRIKKSSVSFASYVKTECEKVAYFKELGIRLFLLDNDFTKPLTNENLLIDKNQFSVLLRNFVVNAIKHGFTNEISDKILLFSLDEDDDFYYINMINNGVQLPESVSFEDYLSFGGRENNEKGSGIGGFLIGKVIENHGGSIEMIPNDKTIYIDAESVDKKRSISFKAGIHLLIKLPKE
jgi:type I restriction-modification system DNA methylase subunit/signal transduction histidine kinase